MSGFSVTVVKRAGRTFWQAEWSDPVTGRIRSKSTGEKRKREAMAFAARLEHELNNARQVGNTRLSWLEFREIYERDAFPALSLRTQQSVLTAFRHVERVIDPAWLTAVDSQQIRRLVADWRKSKLSSATINGYLGHLRAALNWAVAEQMLQTAPQFRMAKNAPAAKGRPITTEEFERMLDSVEKVVPTDRVNAWKQDLRGLWWSGLRLGEALALHTRKGDFVARTDGRRPVFEIQAAGQKSRKAEICPMAPEFAAFLQEHQPPGRVFQFVGTARRVDCVSKIICSIGKEAGVKVAEKRTGPKYASAHDLRRSFGARWALKVLPAVLQRLMRHEAIATTMRFYAQLDADAVADSVWSAVQHETDTFTDTSPVSGAPVEAD